MSSSIEERSDKEVQRNLERFTPLLYQLKGQTGASGQNHSKQREIIGQEPGCYPYPSNDQRSSPMDKKKKDTTIYITLDKGVCFKPKKLL